MTNSSIEQLFRFPSGSYSIVRMSRTRILIKLALIFVIVQPALCEWKPNNREKEVLCQTEECEERGKEYQNNMDTQADPCQDFYTFTCGSWHENHPGPKYASEWSVLDVMNFNFARVIRRTLEAYNFQLGDNILFRQAKQVYETCIKIPNYPRKETDDIARQIMNIDRMPNTSLWDIHSKYLKLSGESAFFRIKILAGKASEESAPVLIVMEPSSAYGSILHEKTWKPQEKQAYTDFLFVIMKSLKLKDSDALIKSRIEKVFEFRKKLEKVIKGNSKKKPDIFTPLSVLQLQKWFSDTLHTQTKTQDISWTKLIKELLQNLSLEAGQTERIIFIRQRDYILDLIDLLTNVPGEVLGNHMEIYFVERHLKLKENMLKLLEATSVEPHGLLRYIREKYYPRWQLCIKDHNMEKTLEKLLFEKWFPQDNANIIHQLNDGIKMAVENQMSECEWLDRQTREDTTKQLKNLEEWIGFPSWLNRVGTPRLRNKKDILTPDAVLDINANLLYVHAPLMLPPLFSPTIPTVYNYAGIGTTLGHELYHVIADCGSLRDDYGRRTWWPKKIRNKCISNKLFFIDVYNEITDRDFKNRYNVNMKSDTSSTILENIPDVMGLKAAYNAYKELANKEKSVCQTLPQFERYSCDQMFYIAFANSYCGYYSKKSAVKKLQSWVHSIDSIRINGAVAQMKSFGTTFGCPVGSSMNPRRKLDLWQ